MRPSPPVQPIRTPAPAATHEELVDEFGDLDLEIQHLAPQIARHKVLKDQLSAVAETAPGDQPCVARGLRWTVQLSPRENRRRITYPRKAFACLKKTLGIDGLVALIKIPLEAAIDKHTSEAEQKTFLVEERVGPRSMKVVPTHGAAPAPESPRAA